MIALAVLTKVEFGLCLVATYLKLKKRSLTPVWETGMISVVRAQRSLTFCTGSVKRRDDTMLCAVDQGIDGFMPPSATYLRRTNKVI